MGRVPGRGSLVPRVEAVRCVCSCRRSAGVVALGRGIVGLRWNAPAQVLRDIKHFLLHVCCVAGQPGMAQRFPDRDALPWIDVHELEDEVLRLARQRRAPAFFLEECREGLLLKQLPVRILHGGAGTVEQRLRTQQVECAPAQAPGVDLGGQVVALAIQLRWSELLCDKAAEKHRGLSTSDRIDGEGDALPGVADPDLPLPVVEDVQKHVLERNILDSQPALVQACQAPSGSTDQKTGLLFLEAAGSHAQTFEEVPVRGQL
mmetsp:Transcript_82802/g.208507  ORF Transcript_82802/g.208507 Transcript_82802/m.208507 type:complete len:261 (-) Transcript_82802:1646-2428(-)